MSKLSIVVITYKMQREAPRTVLSLLPPLQRYVDGLDYEIIVVDNGSPEPLDLDNVLAVALTTSSSGSSGARRGVGIARRLHQLGCP